MLAIMYHVYDFRGVNEIFVMSNDDMKKMVKKPIAINDLLYILFRCG